MHSLKILFFAAGMFLVTACSSQQVYQGLYEGIRVRGQLQTPPPERPGGQDVPTYQQYEILRAERLKPQPLDPVPQTSPTDTPPQLPR